MPSLPAQREKLDYAAAYTAGEHAKLVQGFRAADMDDRWNVFVEDDTLLFCRSWTGHCIFSVTLAQTDQGYEVAEAWVSRDASQYRGTDAAADAQLLSDLTTRLLLERRERPAAPSFGIA